MGDGALLDALLAELDAHDRKRCAVVGYDTDPSALAIGRARLASRYPDVDFQFRAQDFLAVANGHRYDLVIANPPYVRTQIMGTNQAQSLADRYGLTGRVDLYYPFLMAIAGVLDPAGTVGVITSNRFITTKSGQSVRSALLERFRVRHVVDLGDTKLFDAAVLPAITFAQGLDTEPSRSPKFSSIYETLDEAESTATSALVALSAGDDQVVSAAGRRYRVRHGVINNAGQAEGVWRLATGVTDDWLATVEANTWKTFRHIGKIRVGVKTTADKVFLKSDWEALPGGAPELLQPLITRHCARRFKASVPENPKHRKRILYPHVGTPGGGRAAINLDQFPKAKAYLESHRAQLEARTYVIEAGRRWYEIWVPQDPGAWKLPKLVFPDISEKPTFWVDLDGGVVNGECYFLRNDNGTDPDLIWLAMAVANSTFIEAFYDHRFNNKLYSGRRRFITQYVELFPLPDPARAETAAIIATAKHLYDITPCPEAVELAANLDKRVWEVFGLLTK